MMTHRDRLVTHSVLSQKRHDRIQTPPTRSILVKEVPRQENKVHLRIPGNLENFPKGVDAVLPADGVLFSVPDVVVGSEKDTEAAVK